MIVPKLGWGNEPHSHHRTSRTLSLLEPPCAPLTWSPGNEAETQTCHDSAAAQAKQDVLNVQLCVISSSPRRHSALTSRAFLSGRASERRRLIESRGRWTVKVPGGAAALRHRRGNAWLLLLIRTSHPERMSQSHHAFLQCITERPGVRC